MFIILGVKTNLFILVRFFKFPACQHNILRLQSLFYSIYRYYFALVAQSVEHLILMRVVGHVFNYVSPVVPALHLVETHVLMSPVAPALHRDDQDFNNGGRRFESCPGQPIKKPPKKVAFFYIR